MTLELRVFRLKKRPNICFFKAAIDNYHQAVAASFMKWIPSTITASANLANPTAPGSSKLGERKSSKVRIGQKFHVLQRE